MRLSERLPIERLKRTQVVNRFMKKFRKINQFVDEDFSDFLAASSSSMGFWDNEADKIWDNF